MKIFIGESGPSKNSTGKCSLKEVCLEDHQLTILLSHKKILEVLCFPVGCIALRSSQNS